MVKPGFHMIVMPFSIVESCDSSRFRFSANTFVAIYDSVIIISHTVALAVLTLEN